MVKQSLGLLNDNLVPLLCIESSGATGSAGLWHDGGWHEIALDEPHSQAQKLMPAIADLLRQAALSPTALSTIAVNVGPGSFTGIRIGLAAARGLAFALPHTRLIGVSSMQCLVAEYEGSASRLTAIVKAGKGEIYHQTFGLTEHKWHPENDICLSHPDHFILPEGSALIGNASSLFSGASFDPPNSLNARQIKDACLKHSYWQPYAPRPLYVRAPDAVISTRSAI